TRTIAQLHHRGEVFGISLPVPGPHMLANAVAAVAAANLAGEGTAAPLRALGTFGAPEGRGETTRLGPSDKPLLLVDESYNANLASMAAALELYRSIEPPAGRKVLVLGDMLELGAQSGALHATLRDAVLASGASRVFLVGSSMAALAQVIRDDVEVMHAPGIDEGQEAILAGLAHGDSVMVKGSKGVRLGGL